MSNVSAQHVIIVDSGASGSASGQGVLWDYSPATLRLELLIPPDRLEVQTTTEVAPSISNIGLPPTGADPFFQHRQRLLRPAALNHRLTSFWCSSFQRFRPRMLLAFLAKERGSS